LEGAISIVLTGIGVAFAAFCVWLGERIVNRRECWAKWTAVLLVVLMAYPLGTGPAALIANRWDEAIHWSTLSTGPSSG
jgi:multisubunit Na+/H+ antiporter MnhE subunit